MFVLNTGCPGMQTNVAWVLDIICVWVLVVAALIVSCFLVLPTVRYFVVPNKCTLYFLPNTSLHGIAEHGLARCQKFMQQKNTTYDI